ncbi:HAD-IC family P-type ATPase [Halochromatium roseum]|uniref:HAD-IC family P-type ATPase n=1 Tax=Halochromatium roseum TaxID=391920 RepID=UPI00191361C7|nr:HAD-IC family P-type ATPase [Halochromatium roseum]MBK5938382.1 carbonate dehydratase [Halochromatium roseum]
MITIEQLLTALDRPTLDWIADGLAIALLVGYHLYLRWLVAAHPERAYQARADALRHAWVEVMRGLGDHGTLAVNTLRNWVFSASLFATLTFLFGLLVVGFALRGSGLDRLSQALSLASNGEAAVQAKLLLLAALLFTAFVRFALAVRDYNQTVLQISLPDKQFHGLAIETIAETLNRAGNHYHQGTRTLLLGLPVLLWLIGAEWFLLGALLTLGLLRSVDLRADAQPLRAPPTAVEGTVVGDPHALEPSAVLAALHSDAQGLSGAEAARRLDAVGENRLPEPPRNGPIKRFFKHFHDVLIYILLAAAVATAFMGHWIDTWVILGVVLINAIVGFVQEGRAEEALAGIRKMLSPSALARRDGAWRELEAAQLVPGDVVRLRAGDRIPADLRLLEAANLRVEESALTGESVPVSKGVAPVRDDASIGDRFSMGYSGTLVAAGSGLGVVTATGPHTEIGRINRMIAEVETLVTPLIRQMGAFGRVLSVVILGLAAGMTLAGWLLHHWGWGDLMMAAIGFAVAAIPEGLPAIMTITLALGVQQMAQRNAITRKLPAVETLGSVTVICSDKTGTLTRNEMTARHLISTRGQYDIAGVGYAPDGHLSFDNRGIELSEHADLQALIEAFAVCNDADVIEDAGQWRLIGEPTEGALRTLGLKAGFDTSGYQRQAVIPFDSEHKFMATLVQLPTPRRDQEHAQAQARRILMKGALDRLLDRCAHQRGADGQPEPLERAFWEGEVERLSAKGLRVLAAAARTSDAAKTDLQLADLDAELLFLGLVGIIDPPRPEAIEAIATCHSAGIGVKMITGDHLGTASAIGREMGVGEQRGAIAGAQLEAADEAELRRLVAEHDIFARTSPEHKLRIVKALQANGEVVAMTGDGVNDAPALKRADVGVAMGMKGTEATKEAAEIVLADDNFASISRAVEAGRTIYDNLRKSILFILPTNGAQGLVILAAILFGFELPLSPVQILWVNMITSVTLALALAFEPAEPGVMRRPPRRPDAPILGAYALWRILLVSLIIGVATILIFLHEIDSGQGLAVAQTMAVNTLVVGQIFYLLNSRFLLESGLRLRFWLTNPAVWIAITVMLVLQALFVYAPFMHLWFHTAAPQPQEWLLPLGIGVAVLLIVELDKAVMRAVSARAQRRRRAG